eukprot:764851-Hanusia_phi.AAC.11
MQSRGRYTVTVRRDERRRGKMGHAEETRSKETTRGKDKRRDHKSIAGVVEEAQFAASSSR